MIQLRENMSHTITSKFFHHKETNPAPVTFFFSVPPKISEKKYKKVYIYIKKKSKPICFSKCMWLI